MIKIMILATALLSTPLLASVGFKSGNQFQAQYLEGSFTAFCPDGSRVQYCSIDTLSPEMRDKFVHTSVDANEVVLVAEHQQGSRRTKSSVFLGTEGESKKWFNLWIGSLFQRPLLRVGTNKILYSLKKEGKVIKAGTFESEVTRVENAVCRHRHYTFHTQNDCNNLSIHCSRYFLDERDCQ